jgi:hypothetical protein
MGEKRGGKWKIIVSARAHTYVPNISADVFATFDVQSSPTISPHVSANRPTTQEV